MIVVRIRYEITPPREKGTTKNKNINPLQVRFVFDAVPVRVVREGMASGMLPYCRDMYTTCSYYCIMLASALQ